MPETVYETVVAKSEAQPCPMRRTSVAPTPDGRDRSCIYHDVPVKVPVKYHPDARYYRGRLRKGDLVKVAPAPAKSAKSTPAPAPTKKEE